MMSKDKFIVKISKVNGGGEVTRLADDKFPCLTASYHKGVITTYGDRASIMEIEKHIIKPYRMNGGGYRYIGQQKCPTIIANHGNAFGTFPQRPYVMEIEKHIQCVAMRGIESQCLTPKRTEYGKQIRKQYEAGEIKIERKHIQQLEPREDEKTNCLTTVTKDNMIMEREHIGSKEVYNDNTQDSAHLSTRDDANVVVEKCRIRRLTPTEVARLQSIPDWYVWKGKFPDGSIKDTSDTQRYRLCGNGWNVEVIKHIFSFIDLEAYDRAKQNIQ